MGEKNCLGKKNNVFLSFFIFSFCDVGVCLLLIYVCDFSL